jgi:F-type H+-transporting ATPase subunit b
MENDDVEAGGEAEEAITAESAEEGGAHGELTATEEEAAEQGMPQLDPSTFDNQIFWLLVALASIWLVLTRVALPRIAAILATRSGSIGNDLQAAENLRAQAREAQAAHDRALAEARAEAGRIAAQARAEVQAGLDAELAEADRRIEAKATESAARLREIASQSDASVAEVARDAARAVLDALGGRPDDAAVDAAVAQRMRSA